MLLTSSCFAGTHQSATLPLSRTYSVGIDDLVIAAAGTDFFTISGSSRAVIKIVKIEISQTQTAGAIEEFRLIKRYSPDTGGTSGIVSSQVFDSSDTAASAVVSTYTANPATLGTVVGNGLINSTKYYSGASALSGGGLTSQPSSDARTVLYSADVPAKAITLHGSNQVLAINFEGATAAGNVTSITIEWIEQ